MLRGLVVSCADGEGVVFHLYIFVFSGESVVVSCADGERCAKKKADCHLPL